MEIGTSSVPVSAKRDRDQDPGKRKCHHEFHQREAVTHLSNLLNT